MECRNWSFLREKKFLFWGLSKRQHLGREGVSRELWKAQQRAYVPSTERRAFITLLRQIQTTSPPLTFWIAKFHKPNSSAAQTGEKIQTTWYFISKVAALLYPWAKSSWLQLFHSNNISFYTKKCSTKEFSAFMKQQRFPVPHQSTTDYVWFPLLAALLQLGGSKGIGNFLLEFL